MKFVTSYLTVVGKANSESINELTKGTKDSENWYFIDFAQKDVEIGTTFTALMYTDIPGETKCECIIIEAMDHVGNSMRKIEHGMKTVCKLKFISDVPKEIQELPVVKEWFYNKGAIILSSLQVL